MDTNILKRWITVSIVLCIAHIAYAQYKTNVVVTNIDNKVLLQRMQTNATKLLTEFNLAYFQNRKPETDKSQFTENAVNSILSLWENSPFKCIETEIIEKGIKNRTGYEVRNIPLFFKDASADEHEQEAVIIFDKTGLIDAIHISIGTSRVNEILNSNNSVTDFNRRQFVLNFVENFRTAYNRKDIDFLEKVFSPDALIITGKVVKIKEKSTDMMQMNITGEKIEYQRQSKDSYISKMKEIFKGNFYPNVKFDSLEVVQHAKFPDIYGVTLKQYWNTPIYNDVGFVFLMIDFIDEENPIIHVRTWQPEKFDGRKLDRDEVFSLGSFGNYNR